jgi:hypothetical protein
MDPMTRPCKEGVFYECTKCGDVVPSKPGKTISCSCRNIFIDWDAGRISLLEPQLVRLFEAVE